MTKYLVPPPYSASPAGVLSYIRWTLAPNMALTDTKPNGLECSYVARDEIWDRATDHVTIRPIQVPLGLVVTQVRKGRSVELTGPNVTQFRRAVRLKMREIGAQSQKALLPDIFEKLSHVAQVRQTMGPLHTALTQIRMTSELDPAKLVTRKREQQKWGTYLRFLEEADYIRKSGATFVSGPAFDSVMKKRADASAIPTALGQLLYSHYSYMTEVLGWHMMVPYLRWTNAYYWRAFEAGKLPSLDWDAWSSTYGSLYGKQTHGSPLSQAQSLIEAGIIRERGPKVFVGIDEVFRPYQEKAEKNEFLHSVLNPASQSSPVVS